MICPECLRPVGEAEAVPREYPDPRFPSGLVKRIKWVHPECVGPEKPFPEAA